MTIFLPFSEDGTGEDRVNYSSILKKEGAVKVVGWPGEFFELGTKGEERLREVLDAMDNIKFVRIGLYIQHIIISTVKTTTSKTNK